VKITDLPALVAALPPEARARFEQIYHLSWTDGQVLPPPAMRDWIASQFGSADAVRRQRIVKVTNRVTFEGTLFNELRALRPLEAADAADDVEAVIQSSAGGAFCHPEEGTPADTFGRIQGQHALTAANVAKYDGWHGVIVFNEHHPLRFTAEQVADYVDTAQRWAQAAHQADPEACYPFFLWNCLWKSGSSIIHGHAQMTLTRGMHYGRVEGWRQAAWHYQDRYNSNYFADLAAVYQALGLALEWPTASLRGQRSAGPVAILPSLTPYKEKETLIIGQDLDHEFKMALYLVLRTFVGPLQVQSFNLALYQPPLAASAEDWSGFPLIVRIVDRGSLATKTADIGAMEIFGQSVVATDPFRVADALRETGFAEDPLDSTPGDAAGPSRTRSESNGVAAEGAKE
jgi:galactose-1-phosphate uridylyltransferase